jgi:hypothetical protein
VPGACDVCQPPDGAAIHDLGEAGIDSIGRSLSRHNIALWARTDSLYRAGCFGRPGSGPARGRARTHFLLRAWSGLDYLAQLAGDGRFLRADERSLEGPFGARYANTAIYPLRFLREAVVGPRGFRMEYEILGEVDERMPVGGSPVRVRTDRVRLGDGASVPGLSLEILSQLHKRAEMLFTERFCGRVTTETLIDDGDTLEVISMTDIEGMYARKAGTHGVAAVSVWRSRVVGDRDPRRPRIGACAYFPRIQLRLSLLPDLGLDDLRDFDVPQPVVAVSWADPGPRREWLRVLPGALFTPWGAQGPRPRVLRERYPDL